MIAITNKMCKIIELTLFVFYSDGLIVFVVSYFLSLNTEFVWVGIVCGTITLLCELIIIECVIVLV